MIDTTKFLLNLSGLSHLPLHLLVNNLGIAENAGWYTYNMIIVKAKILISFRPFAGLWLSAIACQHRATFTSAICQTKMRKILQLRNTFQRHRPEEFLFGDSAGDFGLRSFHRPEIAVLLGVGAVYIEHTKRTIGNKFYLWGYGNNNQSSFR